MLNSSTGVVRATRHLVTYPLVTGKYAVWNSVFPNVRILDASALARLTELPATASTWSPGTIRSLQKARLVYRGDEDPYEQEFFDTIDKALLQADAAAETFYSQRLPYATLALVNSGCNLGCSYCVSYYGDDSRASAARQADRGDARERAVMNVVDQYMRQRRAHGEQSARFNFNGGEILLRWPLVEKILDFVATEYSDIHIDAHMNSNATLLTDDIAKRLSEFQVHMSISIDGYRENHESTRHYHGGGGSYDRVLAGLNRYRRAARNKMKGFQGTIENVRDFDDEKFFQMRAEGFDRARLAANLLEAPAGKGHDAAFWEASLAIKSQQAAVRLVSSNFEQTMRKLRKADGYRTHCNGLRGLEARILTLNVDAMQISQMCSFVSPAAVPLASINYDIYNPAIWSVTRRYVVDRMNVLKKACQGCDVQGTCQGNCIYTGIDLDNKLNPAACGYQRAMWRHAIDYSYAGELRPIAGTPVQEAGLSGDTACACESKATAGNAVASTTAWPLTLVTG